MKLITDKAETHEAWLTLRSPDKEWEVGITFDGCVHLRKYGILALEQNDEEDIDYIHLCDIDETIEMLKEIKQKATEHFKKDHADLWL